MKHLFNSIKEYFEHKGTRYYKEEKDWKYSGTHSLVYKKEAEELETEYQKLKNPIKVGDKIIDITKSGCSINDERLDNIVICKAILDDNDLVWESLDGKSGACDLINNFIKIE